MGVDHLELDVVVESPPSPVDDRIEGHLVELAGRRVLEVPRDLDGLTDEQPDLSLEQVLAELSEKIVGGADEGVDLGVGDHVVLSLWVHCITPRSDCTGFHIGPAGPG